MFLTASNHNETSSRHLKSIATQTNFDDVYACALVTASHNFMIYKVNCFYCEACFSVREWEKFIEHIDNQHRYKMKSYNETADVDIRTECMIDDIEEDTMELQVYTDIQRIPENLEAEEIEAMIAPISNSELSNVDNVDEMVSLFEIEAYNVLNEQASNSTSTNEYVTVDEFFETNAREQEWGTANNKLQNSQESRKQFNMETSDASLVFFIIDLLQAYPAIWFLNGSKSKKYDSALISFSSKFSEKYPTFMTQTELHESLIEIRDWYQKIFREQNSDELSFPQSEYYSKLAEFLPDTLNGKTCELCKRLFQDHVQYFAHRKLQHAKAVADESEQTGETSLVFLREHVNDYLSARYPRYHPDCSYQCQMCLKKYELKSYFVEHIKTHLDIRDHVCDICGKAFIRPENLFIHKKKHTGPPISKCQICGKQFSNLILLTAHRRLEHRAVEDTNNEVESSKRNNRNFKASTRYVPYTEGKSTHYACPFCEKTYKNKSGAQKHYNLFHKDKILTVGKKKQGNAPLLAKSK